MSSPIGKVAGVTTIVLAEDHQIVGQGLKVLFDAEKTFRVVGEAGDGLEAVQRVEELRPHVLVLDLMMPRLHGLEVIRQVRRESRATKVVILSMNADEQYVMEALRNGATGYVMKGASAGVERFSSPMSWFA